MDADSTKQPPVIHGRAGLPYSGAMRRELTASTTSTTAAIILKAANPKPVSS